MPLTENQRKEYLQLFNTCEIKPGKHSAVDAMVAKLLGHRLIYDKVQTLMGVPWFFVAVVHSLESSLNFKSHLHNGDPLSARTVNVPKNRPKGNPPFTWEVSAADALSLKGLDASTDWSLPGTLYQLERYNGFGYRKQKPPIHSPYLWSFSNHYTKGKYVVDGSYSPTAVSSQCGGAVLLRRMAELGHIQFPDQKLPSNGKPLVVPYAKTQPTDPKVIADAKALQAWLNMFTGVFVRVDGWAGQRTSDAFKIVTGTYLPGDPRA
jgi:lysozyme family protein